MTSGGARECDQLLPLSALSDDEILRYDRQFFPEQRIRFLQAWLRQGRHIALGILGAQGLAGYVVARPCRTGYKIGPLFADTPALAERHQMQRCFETARMYTREQPEIGMDRQYGITTFELG